MNIFPSLASIANKNFRNTYNKIEPILIGGLTFQNHCKLTYPSLKWTFLHVLISSSQWYSYRPQLITGKKIPTPKFIWGGKQPRVKPTTLHRHKIEGGLSVPNFKHYFWSFVLRPLADWLNTDSSPCWKPIESNLASPHRLEDLIYSSVALKWAKLLLGSIMSFLLSTWHLANVTGQVLYYFNFSYYFIEIPTNPTLCW